MRATYRVLAALVALGVVVQAAVIAATAAGVVDVAEGRAVVQGGDLPWGGFAAHAAIGTVVLPLLALALLVVAVRARLAGGVVAAVVVAVLVVVQAALGYAASAVPLLGALHGATALLVFTAALAAGRRGRRAPALPAAPERAVEPAREPADA